MALIKTTEERTDLTNNPKIVVLYSDNTNRITLPLDVRFTLDGEKVIAESKILDGVAVFEKILRNPYKIDFEFTLREVELQTEAIDYTALGLPSKNFIFPQNVLYNLFSNAWQPDTILNIENTLLNKIGIFEIIIKRISLEGVRGSKNLPVRLECLENYTGLNSNETSLIKG